MIAKDKAKFWTQYALKAPICVNDWINMYDMEFRQKMAYARGAQPFLSHEPFQKSIKPNEPTASRIVNMEAISDI